MDLVSIVIFLVLYYVRPHEWISFITALKPVKWSVAFAIVCMFLRKREFHWRDLFQTPHDWMMLLYFLWIVCTNSASIQTAKDCCNMFVFYVVTVQALSSMQRIQTFLSWWAGLIMVVAALAVTSQYGFDFLQSSDVTEWKMKGRLVLNLSIFNNPNALGHSVYPVVLMLYFLLCWRRPIFMKIVAIPVAALPLFCVYLTYSKGAFLAGFVVAVIAMTFGRPKILQLLILLTALTVGWTALWTLPRMGELNRSQTDQAIQGRVIAFNYGLESLRKNTAGVGWNQFYQSIEKAVGFKKGAHSSYVQVGGELGYPGLFLFVGILYCCLRTLLSARTSDTIEERVRRILIVLLVSYMASSWMVGWPWRATFFLMVGAVAGFHRVLAEKSKPAVVPAPEPATAAESLFAPAAVAFTPAFQAAAINPAPTMAVSIPPTQVSVAPTAAPADVVDIQAEVQPVGMRWKGLNWVDGCLMIAMTYATVRFWMYIMHRM